MSDNQDSLKSSDHCSSTRLHIALFAPDQNLTSIIVNLLSQHCYHISIIFQNDQLIDFIANRFEQIDCLVFTKNNASNSVLSQLRETGFLLPIAIINEEDSDSISEDELNSENATNNPQNAEVVLGIKNIEHIDSCIKKAIKRFINLAPNSSRWDREQQFNLESHDRENNFLVSQQRRLAQKLQERLGYLGVYYKRDPQDFYRNTTEEEQKQIIQDLKQEYQQIILIYFDDNSQINQTIDKFVNQAFFLDISIPKILEIHMQLMDEFAQQLKLEGRREEILLDYRLALIDIIAHLCEMYRRSIPRKDAL